ncbi:MAG: DUF1080 domain-containing protein [Phycisphaerae bacterium]|nr:DUF1080 domain-containing protein [Phycisphaerae bacterium]
MNRLSLIAATVLACAAAPAQTTDANYGWTTLPKRDTLDGWVQRGGQALYRAQDGVIIGQSVPNTPNSFLCTRRDYGDFILEYEFLVDPRLNSGVQVRSNSVTGYRDGVVHGYQIEIDPSERAWSAGIYDESRRGWLFSLKNDEAARRAFKQDDWNHVRVVAVGDRIKTWLNGIAAADLTDHLTRTGFIALQVHGTKESEPMEVRWRNIRILDLGHPGDVPPPEAVMLLTPAGDLSTWQHADQPDSTIKWRFADGILTTVAGTGDIVTKQTFADCQIHVEFRITDNGQDYQHNGNSGVYIQQRYEVQILNSSGRPRADDLCGAIYRQRAPDYNMALPAGEWQTYDITFHAPRWNADGQKTANARMTVYHNGTCIHNNVEVTDKTGAGQPEGPADGPLRLQEHGCQASFRNVWICPLDQTTENE